MALNSSVNSSLSETRIDIKTEEDGEFNREPPPPYTCEVPVSPVTNQPVIHQTAIIQPSLKSSPMFYNCPKCEQRVLTKVEYLNSRKTHLFAGFLFGFTLWCLLCCVAAIPYIVNTCKKTHHYCPNCDTFLGAYSRV